MIRFLPTLLLGALVAACSTNEDSAGAELARTEDAGAACPSGGRAIRAGHDRNGNGELDDSEVETTTLVCATTTAKSLVVTEAIAPGAECPAGGTRVRSGIDTNGDGALEPSETTETRLVCAEAGATMAVVEALAPGAECPGGGKVVRAGRDVNGDHVLGPDETTSRTVVCDDPRVTRVTAVPPGAQCLGGGARVESGPDRNGNGKLDDAEVTASEVVCGRVIEGDLRITDAAGVSAAEDIAAVTGNVAIGGAGIAKVHLPAMRLIGGDLRASGASDLVDVELEHLGTMGGLLAVDDAPRLRRIALATLTQVRGAAIVGLPSLETIALPALAESLGSLELTSLSVLTNVALPRLVRVDGTFSVDAPKVRSIAIGSLERVTETFAVRGTTELAKLAAPSLVGAGELDLVDNEALETVSLPRLAEVPGTVWLRDTPRLTSLAGLANLETVGLLRVEGDVRQLDVSSMRLRTAGGISVEGSNLTTLKLPMLTSADRIDLGSAGESNGALSAIYLPALTHCASFALIDAPDVTSLKAPALRLVRDAFVVERTPRLPGCDVDDVLRALSVAPAEVSIDGAATCAR
jgi:hypothetical protein